MAIRFLGLILLAGLAHAEDTRPDEFSAAVRTVGVLEHSPSPGARSIGVMEAAPEPRILQAADTEPPLAPLMVVFALGVSVLLFLILYCKLQAFLALIVASVCIAVGGTLVHEGASQLTELGPVLQAAMASALGLIATVIGIGSIFGSMLEHSGGTQVLGKKLVEVFGAQNGHWAMLLTGFIISIPVFLDVGLVILAPLLAELAAQTGKDLVSFGLPLVVGMMTTHSFVPPTPGPIAVAYFLGAPLGYMIGFGLLVGAPAAAFCGSVLSHQAVKYLGRDGVRKVELLDAEQVGGSEGVELHTNDLVPPTNEPAPAPDQAPQSFVPPAEETDKEPPSFSMVISLISMPVVLILLGTIIEQVATSSLPGNLTGSDRSAAIKQALSQLPAWQEALYVLGSPIIALLCSTLLAIYLLGTRRGISGEKLLVIANKSLEPAGSIILITGAGGMFKGVLGSSGITAALRAAFAQSNMNPLFLAWLVAGLIRIAQGSATVAMITGAGLVAGLQDVENPPSDSMKALTACAICSGASMLSHVNDSGFWMISRYMKLTEKEALISWTPISLALSVVTFLEVLLLSVFIG